MIKVPAYLQTRLAPGENSILCLSCRKRIELGDLWTTCFCKKFEMRADYYYNSITNAYDEREIDFMSISIIYNNKEYWFNQSFRNKLFTSIINLESGRNLLHVNEIIEIDDFNEIMETILLFS